MPPACRHRGGAGLGCSGSDPSGSAHARCGRCSVRAAAAAAALPRAHLQAGRWFPPPAAALPAAAGRVAAAGTLPSTTAARWGCRSWAARLRQWTRPPPAAHAPEGTAPSACALRHGGGAGGRREGHGHGGAGRAWCTAKQGASMPPPALHDCACCAHGLTHEQRIPCRSGRGVHVPAGARPSGPHHQPPAPAGALRERGPSEHAGPGLCSAGRAARRSAACIACIACL